MQDLFRTSNTQSHIQNGAVSPSSTLFSGTFGPNRKSSSCTRVTNLVILTVETDQPTYSNLCILLPKCEGNVCFQPWLAGRGWEWYRNSFFSLLSNLIKSPHRNIIHNLSLNSNDFLVSSLFIIIKLVIRKSTIKLSLSYITNYSYISPYKRLLLITCARCEMIMC